MKIRSYASALVIFAIGLSSAFGAQPYEGEVENVDASAGKVTIKAGPITKFDMGAMSMGYRVSDPAMLENVKVGDKITFDADQIDGTITVTKIDKAN